MPARALSILRNVNDRSVNGVLGHATGSVGGKQNDVGDGEGVVGLNGAAVDGEHVGGERAGLCRNRER